MFTSHGDLLCFSVHACSSVDVFHFVETWPILIWKKHIKWWDGKLLIHQESRRNHSQVILLGDLQWACTQNLQCLCEYSPVGVATQRHAMFAPYPKGSDVSTKLMAIFILHPQLKMMVSKKKLLFQQLMFRWTILNFRGVNHKQIVATSWGVERMSRLPSPKLTVRTCK